MDQSNTPSDAPREPSPKGGPGSYLDDFSDRLGWFGRPAASLPSEPDPLVGRAIGAYRLVRLIARGGMGAVYLAERADGEFRKQVAIKLLPLALASDTMRERFLLERQILAELEHPNVARLMDGGVSDEGLPYIVMEYVEGRPVDVYCAEEGLGLRERLELFCVVCNVVQYAHRRQIVHRDLKPANILVDREGRVKLVDFGIAKLLADSPGSTTLSGVGGRPLTPGYASPEQILGEDISPASDVYALGVLLYRLLTGSLPFESGGRTPREIARHIDETDPEPLVRRIERHQSDTPGPAPPPTAAADRPLVFGLDPVVRKSLRGDPGSRHASAGALAAEVRRSLSGAAPRGGPAFAWRVRRIAWRWRRAGRGVGAAAGFALLVMAALALHTPAGDGPVDEAPAAVAVLPFDYRGSEEHAYLAEGLVDLLSIKLEGAGGLRPIDPRALLSAIQRSGSVAAAPGERAAHVGADYFVAGSIVHLGSDLQLSAALYPISDPSKPLARVAESGPASDPLVLVDRLAARLLAASPRAPPGELTRLAAATSSSLPAVRAYLEGERALRAGAWSVALDRFEEAAAADTTFALAYYRLTQAAGWAQDWARRDRSLTAAHRLRARLPPVYRRLVEGVHARAFGSPDTAESILRAIVESYPEKVEAWFQLGETFQHSGLRWSRRKSEGATPFRRVLELDPGHVPALIHLANLAVLTGESRILTEALARLPPAVEPPLQVRAWHAFLSKDEEAVERLLAELRQRPHPDVHWVMIGLLAGRRWADAERVQNLLLEEQRPASERAAGRRYTGYLHLAHGRWRAARAELSAAAALGGTTVEREILQPWDYSGVWAAALPLIPRADLVEVDRALDARPDAGGALLSARAHLKAYLGQRKAAEALAEALERSGSEDAARSVRVAILFQREEWEAVATQASTSAMPPQVAAFARAEALLRLGRLEQALAIYEAITEQSTLWPVWPLVDERLGRIHDALGRPAEASRYYARVVEVWSGADPHLQPLVERARERQAAASGPLTSGGEHSDDGLATLDEDVPSFPPEILPALPPTAGRPRVLLAPLENRTGSEALAQVGPMAADWMAQGIARLPELEVVNPAAALTFSTREQAGDPASYLEALLAEARPDWAVSGAYYLRGDSLYFGASILDDVGGVVRSVGPIASRAADPVAGVELLREKVTAALAELVDPRLASWIRLNSRPPSFEAYSGFLEGLRLVQEHRIPEALARFEATAALDSSFLVPRLFVAFMHLSVGQPAAADSVAKELESRRDEMMAGDRYELDWIRAELRGDAPAGVAATRRLAELAPGSHYVYQHAWALIKARRPAAAVRALLGLAPDRGFMDGFISYWGVLRSGYHHLGRHADELAVARAARAQYPDDPWPVYYLIAAHGARGDVDEIFRLLDAKLLYEIPDAVPGSAEPRQPPAAGLRWAMHELLAHGHRSGANRVLDRALDWYETRIDGGGTVDERTRFFQAEALYLAGRLEEADERFRALLREDQGNAQYRAHLGLVAARSGEWRRAERVAEELAESPMPYRHGEHLYWSARIRAALGQREQALEQLGASVSAGLSHPLNRLHWAPELTPLRADPRFRVLVRPPA